MVPGTRDQAPLGQGRMRRCHREDFGRGTREQRRCRRRQRRSPLAAMGGDVRRRFAGFPLRCRFSGVRYL